MGEQAASGLGKKGRIIFTSFSFNCRSFLQDAEEAHNLQPKQICYWMPLRLKVREQLHTIAMYILRML